MGHILPSCFISFGLLKSEFVTYELAWPGRQSAAKDQSFGGFWPKNHWFWRLWRPEKLDQKKAYFGCGRQSQSRQKSKMAQFGIFDHFYCFNYFFSCKLISTDKIIQFWQNSSAGRHHRTWNQEWNCWKKLNFVQST